MVGEAGSLGFQAWLLIPLAAFLGYALLFFLVGREPQDSPIRGFTFYVGALVAWSFSSLMIVLGVEPATGFWEYAVVLAYAAVPCAFFWFVLVCWRENGRRYILPLGGFAFAAAVVLSGAAVTGVRADGHRVVLEYGPLAPYLHLFLGVYIVLILFALVRMLRRNASLTPARLKLPLAGALLVLAGFVGGLFSATGYPVESLFHLGNVALIGFAVFRHHLLSTGGVWGYSLLFLGLAGVFTGVALLAVYLAGVALQFQAVLFWLAVGALLTALYQPLNDGMQRLISRMTRVEKRREMVAHFISVAPTILDLRELVDLMLAIVGRAVRCRYACLFLKDYQRNQYRLYRCSAPAEVPVGGGDVAVDEKNLVVQWLKDRAEIVDWDVVESEPDLRDLVGKDTGVFRKLGARLLVPLNLRGEMIGFLLLSHRLLPGPYSVEDRALLTSLSSQAAVAIGNARLYDHARTEAITDGLTGLFNRRFLEEAIQRELARHSRYGHRFCVLLIDVDYFKKYNDQRGHLAGDKVLVRLGRIMKKVFRGTDVVARYGGEEFAVLLTETGVEQAVLTAERSRATLARELVPDDPDFGPLTVSIGVSGCPVHGVTAEELFQRADEALYQAKELGRNLVCLNTHNLRAGGEDGYLQ